MRKIVSIFIFILFYTAGHSQIFDYGLKFKLSLETTDYSNTSFIGKVSGNRYTFQDLNGSKFMRMSYTFGSSIYRTLPRNFLWNLDLSFGYNSLSPDFRFLEHPSTKFIIQTYCLMLEYTIHKKIRLNFIPNSDFLYFQLGGGFRSSLNFKNLVETNNASIPEGEFADILYINHMNAKSFYKLDFTVNYQNFMDFIFGISNALTENKSILGIREKYFDFGVRIYLNRNGKLARNKVYRLSE